MGTGKKTSAHTAAAKPKAPSAQSRSQSESEISTLTPELLWAACRTLIAVTACHQAPACSLTTLDTNTDKRVKKAVQAVRDVADHHRKQTEEVAVVRLVHAVHTALARHTSGRRPKYSASSFRSDLLAPALGPKQTKLPNKPDLPSRLTQDSSWQVQLSDAAVAALAQESNVRLAQDLRCALSEFRFVAPWLAEAAGGPPFDSGGGKPPSPTSARKADDEKVEALASQLSQLIATPQDRRGQPKVDESRRALEFAVSVTGFPEDTIARWLRQHRATLRKESRETGGRLLESKVVDEPVSAAFFHAPLARPRFADLLTPLGGAAIARAAMAELPAEEQLIAAVSGSATRLRLHLGDAGPFLTGLTEKQRRLRALVLELAEVLTPDDQLPFGGSSRMTAVDWCDQHAIAQTAHVSRWVPVLQGQWATDDWQLAPPEGWLALERPDTAAAGAAPGDDNAGE